MKSYEELVGKLEINMLKIDDELIHMPSLVQETAELAAQNTAEEHAARHALDVITAETASRLREPEEGRKAKSETQIASELAAVPEIQAARDAYDSARLASARSTSLHYSMREKVRLLGKCCDMIVAGFITPSSYSRRPPERK